MASCESEVRMNDPAPDPPPRPGLPLGLMILTIVVGGAVTAVLAIVISQVTPVYKDLGQKLPTVTVWYLQYGPTAAAVIPVIACVGFAFTVMRDRPHQTVTVGTFALVVSGLIAAGGIYALTMPMIHTMKNL